MGAASSMALPDDLDASQKSSIVATMRDEYNSLVANGTSEEEVQQLLTERFRALVAPENAATNGATASPKPVSRRDMLSSQAAKLVPTGLKKALPGDGNRTLPRQASAAGGASGGAKTSAEKKGPTRRRSYGERESKKIMNGAVAAAELAVSQSEATLTPDKPNSPELVEEARDSWDSVSQLPYCNVCQMAFKSMSVLDRHTKYSEMHLKAVKRLEETAENAATTSSNSATEVVPLPKALPRQVEGQDYKLLYSGSKFFWRTQDNIDLSFFHHLTCSVIEIVPFNVYKNKELERLYFDLGKIHAHIDPDVEEKIVALRADFKDAQKTDKFQSQIFPEEQERLQLTRLALTTYLLTRLHLQQVVPDKPVSTLTFIHSSLPSENGSNPFLPEPPSILIPVTVVHRRNTSTEEVKQKINELEIDQKALRQNIQKAENIAAMIHGFASIFGYRKRLMAMSLPRRRWILAVRKVIQIAAVTRTRARLEALEKGASSPGAAPPVQRRKRGASQYIKESHV